MNKSVQGCVASAAIFFIILAVDSFATAEELAYRWEAGQKFSYEVEIVVDSDVEKITYQGMIHYTVGNVNDSQSTVTYRGGLNESKKSKVVNRGGPFGPRGFGPPSIPSPFSRPTFRGKTQTTNKITITPRGNTLAMQGDSQLPYLLGHVSLLPFESLPSGDTDKWVDDGGVSITEESDNDRDRFGPFGRFGPMSPFDRRSNEPESVQAAGELSSYQIQSTQGDLVVVSKSYRLNTPPTKDNPSFDMTGNGNWAFDKKENVPHSYDMKFKLLVKVKNTTTTVPISVKYKRVSAEKIAEMDAAAKQKLEQMTAAAAEKKRIAETPLTAAEKQQTLAALASGGNQIRATLDKLAAKALTDPDPEIAAAIEPHLTSSDRLVAKSAHNAMTKWSSTYAKQKKLEKDYQGPSPIGSTGRVVESITPLYVGQIVQARRNNRGTFWFAARIKQLLPDGKVELGFLTWGEERGRSSETVARNQIQLPPEEYIQSVKPPTTAATTATPTASAATATARTWSDATGRFKIEADFVSVTDGKVTLRRKDGKTMEIPVEKLSGADQDHVKQLQAEMKSQADNPFKLVE